MIMRPPISTRTYKLFPYTTLLRSDTPVPDVGRGYAPDTRATSVARVTFRQTPRHLRSGLRPRRPASSPYPGFRFRPAPHLVVGRGYAPDPPRPLRIPGLGFDSHPPMSYVGPTAPTHIVLSVSTGVASDRPPPFSTAVPIPPHPHHHTSNRGQQ